MRALLLLVFVLAACTRPMTEGETEFAKTLFGPSLDTDKVRVARGIGITPLGSSRVVEVTRMTGTERACVRQAQPRNYNLPPAFAYQNRLHMGNVVYSGEHTLGWPEGLRYPQALIFAHELTHVWQWQNRAETGYSPTRALSETFALADPYFAPPGTEDFDDYGFEQQAAMVADFLCFTAANPDHPRRAELRQILAPVLQVDQIEDALLR